MEKYLIPERCIDKNLKRVVIKHIDELSAYTSSRPISEHTKAGYTALERKPDILDAGCGFGRSTKILSQRVRNEEHLVLGVDRSEARLKRIDEKCNYLRAELADFWRLLQNDKHVLEHTCILYPNPYPKNQHLKRRWHGHPIFPLILQTTKGITLRASWRTYLDEFLFATQTAADHGFTPAIQLLSSTEDQPEVCCFTSIQDELDNEPLTHFEAKYRNVNLPLYELRLGQTPSGLFPSFDASKKKLSA